MRTPIWNCMSKVVVWFDGSCPLCRREIALMRRLDRRGAINFVDVTGDDVARPIPGAALMARLHAEEDGRLLNGAAAFAAMWRVIPALRPMGLLARSPRVLRGLERLYVAFLKVRPKVQRLLQRMDNRAMKP